MDLQCSTTGAQVGNQALSGHDQPRRSVRFLLICFVIETSWHENQKNGCIIRMGLAYLAGKLRAAGHRVEQYYCPYCDDQNELVANVCAAINNSSAEAVGFSITSDNLWMLKICARYVSEHHRIPIVVGGPHAIIDPASVLELDGVTGVCLGEGELPLVRFVNALADGKPFKHLDGWWFKGSPATKGVLHDIDCLTPPDREGYLERYAGSFRNGWVFQSHRGCPHRCTFCAESYFRAKFKGKKYQRSRSVANLIEEINCTIQRYPSLLSKFVGFSNPTFNISKKWLIEFCERYGGEVGNPFGCDLELSNVDQETVTNLKRAGCRTAWIGFESGNDFIRRDILKKNLTTRNAIKRIELLRSAGIEVELYVIVGLPFETEAMIEDTYRALKFIAADTVLPSIFLPLPGTTLGELCYENGWAERITAETARPVKGYYCPIVRYPHITGGKIQRYYEKIRELNGSALRKASS